jgi:nucleosome assembly protein 1-like 1
VPDISEDAEPGEESANVHDAVFGLVQGRLAGLLGKSSGYVESLPDGAKKTLEALKGVQVRQNELQNQYKRECLELEKKVSHPIRVPFFFFSLLRPSPSPSPSTAPASPYCPNKTPPLPSKIVGWLYLLLFPSPVAFDPKSGYDRR